MKSLIFQEVFTDIEIRMNFFDKNRINKNNANIHYDFDDTNLVEVGNKESVLNIVTEEYVLAEEYVVAEKKILDFVKSDDFFLTPEEIAAKEKLKAEQQIDSKKEAKQSFFKSISKFFADSDEKVVDKKETIEKSVDKKVEQTIIEIVPEIIITESDKLKEADIKAEKLRLIEEEFRIKAEKREADEKLASDKTIEESKKLNADFRKNKRKK
jgi:hypothetical protein